MSVVTSRQSLKNVGATENGDKNRLRNASYILLATYVVAFLIGTIIANFLPYSRGGSIFEFGFVQMLFGIVTMSWLAQRDMRNRNQDFQACRQLLLDTDRMERERLVCTHQEILAREVYSAQREGKEAEEEKRRKAFEDFASQVKAANIGVSPKHLYFWLHKSDKASEE